MAFYDTLIGAGPLRQALGQVVLVDCRFDLSDPGAGFRHYRRGHIPGAAYAHLDHDLAAPITPHSGRHPLPDPDELARRLGQWGITNRSQVVVYDNERGAHATRLWWMLRWLGHRAVAVLDGGYAAWVEAGGPVETGTTRPAPGRFQPHPDRSLFLDAAEVAGQLSAGTLQLVDVRDATRFRGEQEPIDTVAGHIPGAINIPYSSNLDAAGRFLPAERLRETYRQLDPDRGTLCAMCGSGVTACHGLMAMELAGLHGAKLYPGSWSEWIRDPSRPRAVG